MSDNVKMFLIAIAAIAAVNYAGKAFPQLKAILGA